MLKSLPLEFFTGMSTTALEDGLFNHAGLCFDLFQKPVSEKRFLVFQSLDSSKCEEGVTKK